MHTSSWAAIVLSAIVFFTNPAFANNRCDVELMSIEDWRMFDEDNGGKSIQLQLTYNGSFEITFFQGFLYVGGAIKGLYPVAFTNRINLDPGQNFGHRAMIDFSQYEIMKKAISSQGREEIEIYTCVHGVTDSEYKIVRYPFN